MISYFLKNFLILVFLPASPLFTEYRLNLQSKNTSFVADSTKFEFICIIQVWSSTFASTRLQMPSTCPHHTQVYPGLNFSAFRFPSEKHQSVSEDSALPTKDSSVASPYHHYFLCLPWSPQTPTSLSIRRYRQWSLLRISFIRWKLQQLQRFPIHRNPKEPAV